MPLNEEIASKDELSAFEAKLAVKIAVKGLPYELQELILLRFANEMGIGEIASITGVSRFAVYRKLNIALAKLKAMLREEDFS